MRRAATCVWERRRDAARRADGQARNIHRGPAAGTGRWEAFRFPSARVFRGEFISWTPRRHANDSSDGGATNDAPKSTVSALLALLFFTGLLVAAVPFLVTLAVTVSHFAALLLFLGAPLLLFVSASVFGVLGVLVASAIAMVGVPLFSVALATKYVLLPAMGASLAFSGYRRYVARGGGGGGADEARAKQAPVAAEQSDEEDDAVEQYYAQQRDALHQFDERLGRAAAASSSDGESARFASVTRWTSRDVAREAAAAGLPRRVCHWLEREHVTGRVVQRMDDADLAELLSSAKPPLTFGERKLLRELMRALRLRP